MPQSHLKNLKWRNEILFSSMKNKAISNVKPNKTPIITFNKPGGGPRITVGTANIESTVQISIPEPNFS